MPSHGPTPSQLRIKPLSPPQQPEQPRCLPDAVSAASHAANAEPTSGTSGVGCGGSGADRRGGKAKPAEETPSEPHAVKAKLADEEECSESPIMRTQERLLQLAGGADLRADTLGDQKGEQLRQQPPRMSNGSTDGLDPVDEARAEAPGSMFTIDPIYASSTEVDEKSAANDDSGMDRVDPDGTHNAHSAGRDGLDSIRQRKRPALHDPELDGLSDRKQMRRLQDEERAGDESKDTCTEL